MRYRKKPVVIEARRFEMLDTAAQEALADWCGGKLRGMMLDPHERFIQIPTLGGELEASHGDWIIRGVKGEYYPCKPDIFELTYDKVEE
mgnify:CR=1 FL=1